MYLRLQPLLYSKHTWYNSDSLQGSEDSKCPESGKVAQIYAHRHITAIHPNITHITVIQTKRQNKLEKSRGGVTQLRKRLLATFPISYQKSARTANVYRKVAITACTIQCNMPHNLPRVFRLFFQRIFQTPLLSFRYFFSFDDITLNYFYCIFNFNVISCYFLFLKKINRLFKNLSSFT